MLKTPISEQVKMVKRNRRKVLPNSWEETPWMSEFIPGCKVAVSQATREEMESHRSSRGRACEYVDSGTWIPSYRMSDASLGYYLHWRDMVRRGRFIRTDMGYIRLLISEMVTFNESPSRDLALMARIVREYRDINIFQIGTVGDACICFARLNDLPLPRVEVLNNIELISYQTYDALRTEGIGYLSVHNLTKLFGIDVTLPKDVPFDALYHRIVSEIDDRMVELSDCRLCDSLSSSKRMVPVYNGLAYHGNRKSFSIELPKDLTGSIGGQVLETALRVMLVGCGCEISGRTRWNEEDLACDMAEDITQRFLDGELDLETMDDTFALDPRRIEESENDLMAVTELMRVEDEDDCSVKEVTVPKDGTDDLTGWEGLSASLDDDMRGYIGAVLEGRATEYLKERDIRMSAMENAINTIAMDMTGDIIVEDGRPIEDYIDEMEEMIG